MPPPRKETCDCGVPERASREPEHPIRFDTELNEYFIRYGDRGRMMIYYCPFRGGRVPKSRRASLFEYVSDEEGGRISSLFEGIRTEQDVRERFGAPDREDEMGSVTVHPEQGAEPSRGETFRTLTYLSLSAVAEVTFEIGTNGRARGGWSAKPKREKNG